MKNLIIVSSFIVPCLLFSYELDFNKNFKKEIQNDKVQTNISINVYSKEIDYINEKIEFFQDYINEKSSVEKMNGNYSLLPKYNYENSKQIFVGYAGTLSYEVQSKEYEEINEFVSSLNQIRKNMDTSQVTLSTSNVQWIVSDKLLQKNIDSMRIETIDWIEGYLKTLNDACEVKKISINKNNGYRSPRYSKNMMMETSSSLHVVPSKTNQSIELNANYILECK